MARHKKKSVDYMPLASKVMLNKKRKSEGDFDFLVFVRYEVQFNSQMERHFQSTLKLMSP